MTTLLRFGPWAALALLAVSPATFVRAESPGMRSKPAIPEEISFGERVSLVRHLVPGKVVVFGFTSDRCPPGHAMGAKLDLLHAARADVVVIKVIIDRPDRRGVDWGSPVARQFKLPHLPAFAVFSPAGEKVADGEAAEWLVQAWLDAIAAGKGPPATSAPATPPGGLAMLEFDMREPFPLLGCPPPTLP